MLAGAILFFAMISETTMALGILIFLVGGMVWNNGIGTGTPDLW